VHSAVEDEVHLFHVQDLTTAQTSLTLARGLRRGLGVETVGVFRDVVTRIRFEDEQRRPLVWPQGDIHHRNETLTGFGDPWLVLHAARNEGPWTLSARAGASLPAGRTEPNPFELGRQGLPHQHIQFGTGTVDPILGLGAGRRLGSTSVGLTALGHFTVATNDHGYRSGNRYQAVLQSTHRLAARWQGAAAVQLLRETAETWSGRVEEEGNLGRTDVLLALALTRAAGRAGLTVGVQVPLYARATGSQLSYPVIVSMALSR
jgi:hypothetical protein